MAVVNAAILGERWSISAAAAAAIASTGMTRSRLIHQLWSGLRLLEHDDARQLVKTVSPDPDGPRPLRSRAITYKYDSDGLVTTTTRGISDSDGSNFAPVIEARSEYDGAGRKSAERLVSGGMTYSVVQYSYDAVARLDCTAVRMNPGTYANLPQACVLGDAGAFGPDRISRNGYDAEGRLTSVTVGLGTSAAAVDVTSTYSDNEMLKTEVDGKGNKTSYEYDGYDRLAKTNFPSKSETGAISATDYEELGYDPNGNVVNARLRDASAIKFNFDNLDRLSTKDFAGIESDTSYEYDLLGRMTKASKTSSVVGFNYDALGRLVSEGETSRLVKSEYDAGGRRIRITWPDNFFIRQEHLVTGEIESIAQNGTTDVLATYGYDNFGRRISATFGNGSATSYEYDGASRLKTLAHNLAGTDADVSFGFRYSPANEIIENTRSNDNYATAGHSSGVLSTPVDGLNEITPGGSVTPSYDGRGNMTSDGTKAYSYSGDDELTNAGEIGLTYDSLGRLAKVVNGANTSQFLYDGNRVIGEYSATGQMNLRYVFGPGADEPLATYFPSGLRYWYHADERGSIVTVSDPNGVKTGFNRYDEYGNPAAGNWGLYQYTGQKLIYGTKLYDYKNRVYNPSLRRFAQADPLGYYAGMNLYAYVGGDPVNLTDPDGTQASRCGIVASDVPTSCGHRPTIGGVEIGWWLGFGISSPWMDAMTRDLDMAAAAERTGPDPVPSIDDIVVTGTRDEDLEEDDATGINSPGPIALDGRLFLAAEHTKNKRPSTKNKHQKAEATRKKATDNTQTSRKHRPNRKRPKGWTGKWPPKGLWFVPDWLLDRCNPVLYPPHIVGNSGCNTSPIV